MAQTRPRPHLLAPREIDAVFTARHVALCFYAVTTYIGRDVPWWEVAVDFGAMLPFSLWCHRLGRRQGSIPRFIPLVDAVLCVAWVSLDPLNAPALTSVLLATMVLNGLAVDNRWHQAAFAISAAGGLLVTSFSDDPRPLIHWSRYCVLGGTVLIAFTIIRKGERRAQERAQHLALHDPLTGLPNRAAFEEAARSTIDEDCPGALMLADLDNFKEINDTLGHHIGDRVLIEIAGRLRDLGGDLVHVARLGGDEFVIMSSAATRRRAVEVADRIASLIAEPLDLEGLTIETRASLGIALFTDQGQDPAELLRQADVAMYQAKASAWPYRVYDPDTDHSSVRRLSLLGELRHAIAASQMELWYQPILGLHRDCFIGAEALVRWRHPHHGLIMPGEFIELAELSGAIDDLTRWATEQAVLDAHRMARGGHAMSVGVNLAVRNLHDSGFVAHVEGVLGRHGLPPNGMWVELTETQLMDDPVTARSVLGQLGDLGILTSIDDFGTGHSSLSLLRHVKAGALKIDRSFVSELMTSDDASILVDTMVSLGHQMGMLVVAEGIEDEATLEEVRRRGCDGAQGYHLSRPLPIDELLTFLGTVRTDPVATALQ